MANFYARRINYDINRITEVPVHWRQQVIDIINNR